MISTSIINKMNELKLKGMLSAYKTSLEVKNSDSMTNDEFLEHLLDAEWNEKENGKKDRRLFQAKFSQQASIEEIDFTGKRNLDKNQLRRLASCDFIKNKENVIITGATGVGKSFIATALGYQACINGYRVIYYNLLKLFTELNMSIADHSYSKLIKRISKRDLLILDDFGLHTFSKDTRLALLEIIEDRQKSGSIVITSQLPVAKWHETIGESTIADAILDRIAYSSHRIELEGESMRKKKKKLTL